MIQRWDDLTPEEQQRYLTAEELRQQLATVTAERDAWKQEADDERKSMRSALQIMQERAEALIITRAVLIPR